MVFGRTADELLLFLAPTARRSRCRPRLFPKLQLRLPYTRSQLHSSSFNTSNIELHTLCRRLDANRRGCCQGVRLRPATTSTSITLSHSAATSTDCCITCIRYILPEKIRAREQSKPRTLTKQQLSWEAVHFQNHRRTDAHPLAEKLISTCPSKYWDFTIHIAPNLWPSTPPN